MKNSRWMNGRRFSLILCGLMTWFFVMPAMADAVTNLPNANYKVGIEIETRHLTKEQALAYVASGEKVTLDVYLVLRGAEWATFIQNNYVTIGYTRLSYALFENTSYTLGDYLQNPLDHIVICVNKKWQPVEVPASDYCQADEYSNTGDWFINPAWQEKGGSGGKTLEWPTYAYSVGNDPSSNRILLSDSRVFQEGNNIKVRLYQLEFILKDATRDYPVGLLDENLPNGINGSHGAAEVNIKTAATDLWVWPGYPSVPGTTKTDAKDWTDCRTAGSDLFTFINGGLFIQTGPEVETFEPYFGILSFSNRLTTNNLY